MYEAPIKPIKSNIDMQVEDGILKAIQRIDIEVDKYELIKALNYDRSQYEKTDALIDAMGSDGED